MASHLQFAEWVEWTGWSVRRLGSALSCSPSFITMMARGSHKPGRALASRIERVSAAWPEGPLRVAEWDPVPDHIEIPTGEAA